MLKIKKKFKKDDFEAKKDLFKQDSDLFKPTSLF